MTQTPDNGQNPLDALGLGGGGGGFDMGALLEQAQQMQSQLVNAQAELASSEVNGTSGGVSVTVTGLGELVGVQIAPGTFDGSSAEDMTDLGDLVVAAFRDAKTRADALAAAKMGPLSGGMPGLG